MTDRLLRSLLSISTLLLLWAIPHGLYAGEMACLSGQAPTSGIKYSSLLNALKIEARKSGTEISWKSTPSLGDCPEGAARFTLGPGLRASLVFPNSAETHVFQLNHFDPANRTEDLARAVMNQWPSNRSRKDGITRLIDPEEDILLGGSDEQPTDNIGRDLNPQLWTWTSGQYLHQVGAGRNLAGLGMELGLSLYDEQLIMSLNGSFLLGSDTDFDGVQASFQAGELLAMVRGGFPLGPLLLRGALGGGWQWRMIGANSEGQANTPIDATSNAAVLAADLESLWPFSDRWRLFVILTGRAYLGGATHLWLGNEIYDAPSAAFGAQLGVGVIL